MAGQTKGRGSLPVPKVEQTNRSGVYVPALCGSDGRMLVKTCEEEGHLGNEQKLYEPLDLLGTEGGLRLALDGSGNPVLRTVGDNNSGTLIIDDGANWRVELNFLGGVLSGAPILGASVGAGAWWTPL